MKTGDAIADIYLDIETAPGEEPRLDSFTPDGRLKDPVKIAASIEDKKEKAWRDQLLNPFEGTLFCVGLAVNDEAPFVIAEMSEESTIAGLEDFLQGYSFPRIYAHYGFGFDFNWLFYKGLKYGARGVVGAFCKSSSTSALIDTAQVMSNLDRRGHVSLDNMSRILLGESAKLGIDGSMVFDYLKDGRGDEVIEYCKRDIEFLRRCCKELDRYGLLRQ